MNLRLLPALLYLATAACTTESTELAAHKELVRRSHEQVWSKGNLELVDRGSPWLLSGWKNILLVWSEEKEGGRHIYLAHL